MNETPDWFTQMLTEATMTGDHEAAWTNFNRWAAFTDDELTTQHRCLRSESPHGLLVKEVAAEIERRKT